LEIRVEFWEKRRISGVPAVTIRDVAKEAGVSIATVSRVLNNSPVVRPDTRDKVLAVIEETGYRPNLTARRLSIGRTHSIAIILPFLTIPSFVERLRGVQSVLSDTEYELMLIIAEVPDRIEDSIDRLLNRSGVDGAILVSLKPNDRQIRRFQISQLPLVLIDACHDKVDCVLVDDVNGGYTATSHLVKLGHRQIAFLSDYLENPFNFVAMRQRFQGYLMALEEADIDFRTDYHQQGELGGREAYHKARKLLLQQDRPTAVFAASDTHAVGVLNAAHDLSIRVPEDLSVVGYDDIRDAEYLNLTTIRQHLFDVGARGAQMLMTTLAGNSEESGAITLPVELVIRGTTASLA
jgi:DNA-binding LacI/PurR family transcriptional regulator